MKTKIFFMMSILVFTNMNNASYKIDNKSKVAKQHTSAYQKISNMGQNWPI